MAEIHAQLREDCLVIGRFPLCHLLLMQDANYPWFILVPDREGVTEIYQLSEADQHRLMQESSCLAEALAEQFQADKINIAALGNMVPQLHIHHVVRYRNDTAWPDPIWGKVPAISYSAQALELVVEMLKDRLSDEVEFLV